MPRMPLVTLTLRAPKAPAFKHAILDGVHRALVVSGVPGADRFQRVLELPAENFRFDPKYPDLVSPRTEDFALIEILWSVGRSVKVKRKVVADIVAALAEDPGLDAEHVMIVFKETQWENWAFGGGRLLHA
jgi:phenylpyruvate tautomerase PptA (4-oxalocrotonate tautomerase family)